MKLDTVNWRETFRAGTGEIAWRPERPPPAEVYDLATALRIVRRMESSAGRGAVFEEIKSKNLLYRVVDTLYAKGGASLVQPLMLFAYMLKCVVSIGPFDQDGAEAVAISNFANERHTVERVAALVPDIRLLRLSLERRHAFRLGQAAAALRLVGALGRIWRFLRALARLHGFMPSARIASALAFYMRFSQLFAERPALSAAIVASNYSPEAVGMAAAAHLMRRRVVYSNHAPVPANGAVVPPVLADCAIFYGEAMHETYQRRSRCTADVALIGQPWTSRPMEWHGELHTVGIFLTARTRPDAVSDLVLAIRASRPDLRILIRNHPVALLQTDFSALQAQVTNLEVTIGTPLDDEILACDLIVCGNSGVAMNALSGGRPVAYMDGLDHVSFDYNGFVESGLVCHVEGWSDDLYARLRGFYGRPEWQGIMRRYDASYGADAAAIGRAAAATIRRHLRPAEGRDRAAFPTRPRQQSAAFPVAMKSS